MTDWANKDPKDWPYTPPLNDFREMYAEDDNWWWRIDCGHHQNLFEAADYRLMALIEDIRNLPLKEVDGSLYVMATDLSGLLKFYIEGHDEQENPPER